MGVAAILLAPSVEEVDHLKQQLYDAKSKDSTSLIGRIRSIRDYAPSEADFEEKLFLIEDIKDQVSGQWTQRIEDADLKAMIADFIAWEPPTAPPTIEEIPNIIKANYVSRNGTGHFLVTVNPSEERKDGRNAMAFTDDLYSVSMDKSVKGPIGETVVFAEVLKLVTSESWWIALATFAGVVILIFLNNHSVKRTLVVLVPLVAGMMLTFGIFALAGFKLTFFNMVVIPALLGMGVDGGIHYVQRWFEVNRDTDATQKELFEPLSLAIVTTMLGYSGMMFANHSGISSIGNFAVIGLGLIWFATLVFLPGILKMFERKN
jgi:predicted RND superfamily exporter protein